MRRKSRRCPSCNIRLRKTTGKLNTKKKCTDFGKKICDWCSGMWIHDCH